MPVRVDVDPAATVAVLIVTDPYTFDEWKQAMETVLDSIVYLATSGLLVDRRGTIAPSLHFVDQMMEFFRANEHRLGKGRAAIVVDETVAYGMGRMVELKAQIVAPAILIRVFREYADATRWLTRRSPGTPDSSDGK